MFRLSPQTLVQGFSRTEGIMYLCGLCECYPPFKSSKEFGRVGPPLSLHAGLTIRFSKALETNAFELNTVMVSKVGLATHSPSDGPYMDPYLVHQLEGMSTSRPCYSAITHTSPEAAGSSESG